MRTIVLSLALVAVAVAPADAQRNFDDVEIQVSHVAGSVYMFVGAGGNIGVSAGDDGLLMVDDQFAPLAPKIQAALDGVGMMRNINHILGQVSPSTRIIPGHGPLAGVADLRRYRDMLETMVDLVTEKKADGKSLEQIQSEGVPAEYDSWGAGFINAERWLESVYRSLD